MTYIVLSPPDRDAVAPKELEAKAEEGAVAFAKWFTRVMDGNGWSHPQLVALCKAVTGDKAFLHSSQIAGLRQARLKSPGPRSFSALEYLWYGIDRYQKEYEGQFGRLASLVEHAGIMRDPNGNPASMGYMLEVFSGLRPVPVDLSKAVFSEDQAERISNNAARLVRRLMAIDDLDPVFDIDQVIKRFPGSEEAKAHFEALIKGERSWEIDEIEAQVASLARMLRDKFKYERTANELLEELKK